MCGRYSLICIDDLGLRFRVFDPMLGIRSRFNVAPTDMMPVIIRAERVEAVTMEWGLVTHGTRDERGSGPLINARAETLAERPVFRDLLPTNRCLVPAGGYYEWKREGTRKTPFYIRVKDTTVFAFAGLWRTGTDEGGRPRSCFTILTTEANDLVSPVHGRMPVILNRDDEDRWISGAAPSREEMAALLAPFPSDRMECYAVSPRVNSPLAPNEEGLIHPLTVLDVSG